MNSKLITALLFVLCGIPGVFMFIFSSIFLIATIVDPQSKGPKNTVVLVGIGLIGIFMTLLGVGKLNQWVYSLVFVAIPLSFWLYALINPKVIGGTLGLILFIGLASYLTFYGVQRYYRYRDTTRIKPLSQETD